MQSGQHLFPAEFDFITFFSYNYTIRVILPADLETMRKAADKVYALTILKK